ncbi:complement factor H-related protein 1-like isoform X4 [Erythrolamprus reginae]|uniref:complement factor H-related protein 1-like isoform X4 n=1 Tax=Erythrolamprus reginae TaxID=121349 RepID=UPI00396C7FD1
MKGWLVLVAAFLLWPGCSSQNACDEPDEIDFGEIVSAEKAKYLENDRVQYRCNPVYVLEGPEWIQCKGQEWTPHPPKCLAPCSVTRQQLATKNLLVFGNQRKARLIQSNQSLQFQCNKGYVLVAPSVRKCVDGYIDLPLCISEVGKNCSGPPRTENGDITTLSEKQYRSGSSVEFRCQNYYAIEGQNRSFCDNGTWTKVPICLEITCNSPRLSHGTFRPQRTIYHNEDLIRIRCDTGFTFEPDNGEKVVECTKNGWSPPPKCFRNWRFVSSINLGATCHTPPIVENARISEDTIKKYTNGEKITYQCNDGFEISGSATVTCRQNNWSRLPRCQDVRCSSPPEIQNGQIVGDIKEKYFPQEKVYYQCSTRYTFLGSSFITCLKKRWEQQLPRCTDIGGGCGRPLPVENGDIVELPKATYLQSETVTYQCQNFYTMRGSRRVTCRNGRWSETPTCTAACTTDEGDMSERNITLKYNRREGKIYSEDGDRVQFICRRGYKPNPNKAFTVYCVDGKFDYPNCTPI